MVLLRRVWVRLRTVGTRQNSRLFRSRTIRSRTLPKGPKPTRSRIMNRSRTIGCTNLVGNCLCLETVVEGCTHVPDLGPRASLSLLVLLCTASKLKAKTLGLIQTEPATSPSVLAKASMWYPHEGDKAEGCLSQPSEYNHTLVSLLLSCKKGHATNQQAHFSFSKSHAAGVALRPM